MNPPSEITQSNTGAPARRSRGRWRWALYGFICLLIVGAGMAWYTSGAGSPSTGGRGRPGADTRPTPVAAAPLTVQAMERVLTALGTATARSTVTVHAQVDGQLTRVMFTEGQLVHAGDLLAQVDPRPFEAALAMARAQLERDDAQLQNALLDLQRYRGLSEEDSIPKQQLDTQQALVSQLKGTVNADRAQIETAQLNLTYSHVTAPVSGRTGLRQVDAGNIVHAADALGLVVITEVQPIDVVFPIPQDALPLVLQRMHAGGRLAVEAYDRDGKSLLGTGFLHSTDNQIDTTTGTVKLKAEFANRQLSLFPNQFVNVRLHLETIPRAMAIPAAAVQRGAPGLYVYLVQKDGTVSMRAPTLGITEGDLVQVLDGLAPGDQVVVDGTDKLREGARVDVIDTSARRAAAAATGKSANAEHPHRHRAEGGSADSGQHGGGSDSATAEVKKAPGDAPRAPGN